MHGQSQTPHLSDDALLRRAEVLRSGGLDDPRHRLGEDADPSRLGQGTQGTPGAALTETLERAQNLLAEVQADRVALSGQAAGEVLRRHHDPQGDEGRGGESGDSPPGLSPRAPAFLRDGTARSRRGLADDQQAVGARQLPHHDGLPALPPRTPVQRAESAGLAAGAATADLHTAGRERQQERFAPEKLTVHQLLRRGAERYVTEHRDGQATLSVQSTLAKLSLCRTSALGGRWYECNDCGELTKLYNSCGDRHCPGCSGGKRRDFSERASKLLFDGVDYYQVVFTLPEVISQLALANRQEIADVLFSSAWKALKKTITGEQGYDPAALMVLHTWNQKLESHWHVHALVPGGGPSLSGGSWVTAEAPAVEGAAPERAYLVDAINLRRAFRKFAIAHLQRLRKAGKLSYGGSLEGLRCDAEWDEMIEDIGGQEWVSYIEPPPTETSRAEHVVRYLTRYLTGGPISDHRIVSADDREVTFLAREGRRVGGERKQVPVKLESAEFVRRWCLHIQPDQLTKTRSWGGWSNTRAEVYRERCRAALEASSIAQSQPTDQDAEQENESMADCDSEPELSCEHCGSGSLRLIRECCKPSWDQLLSRDSECSPGWYAASQKLDDIRFWDAAMGEGFSEWYEWYLKSEAESARESAEPTDRPLQLTLPGFGDDETGISTSQSL